MKTISIPADISLNGKPIKFSEFVRSSLLMDKQFGLNYDALLLAKEIFEAANKQPLEISDPAWELACKVVRNPINGYDPPTALAIMPYLAAILAAK